MAVLERGEKETVLAQPHRACLPEHLRMDQRAESEIGRLFLMERVSEAQFWAADRWQSVVAQFRVVLVSPMPTSGLLGRMVAPGVGQDEASGNAERRESEEEMRERVLDQHGDAMRAISALDDSGVVFRVMQRVVLHGEACPQHHVKYLQCGLDALAKLWKLSDDKDLRKMRSVRHDRALWSHEEKEVSIVYSGG